MKVNKNITNYADLKSKQLEYISQEGQQSNPKSQSGEKSKIFNYYKQQVENLKEKFNNTTLQLDRQINEVSHSQHNTKK